MTQDCPQPMDTNLMAPTLPLESNNRPGNHGSYYLTHTLYTHILTRPCVHGDIIHIKLSAPARLDLQVQRFLGTLVVFFSCGQTPNTVIWYILSDKT